MFNASAATDWMLMYSVTSIDHSQNSNSSLLTMLPTCCDAVATRYRYPKTASFAISLPDCYIRTETFLRSGCHITKTPLALINEESRAPQPAKPSEDEQMMITARYCAAAVRAFRVDTQTGREKQRIFSRPLYVQAIDVERGDIISSATYSLNGRFISPAKQPVYPAEDCQINTSGTLNDKIPLQQESKRCIVLLLSEPIEGVNRRGRKNLENILKNMVQAIDADIYLSAAENTRQDLPG